MAKATATTTTDPAVEVVFAAPPATDQVVESWLVKWFHNIGLPGDTQNRIRMAADDLKARLAGKE
jgi:hypothetical protein